MCFQPNQITLMKLPVETNDYSTTIMKNILMKKEIFFFGSSSVGAMNRSLSHWY